MRVVCVLILNRSFNLRLVCCFLRFKKLKELSTAIFDLSIDFLDFGLFGESFLDFAGASVKELCFEFADYLSRMMD